MHDEVTFQTVFPVSFCIGIAHLAVGICIFLDPHVLLVTSLAGIHWVFTVYAKSEYLGGLMLVTAGALAILGGMPFFRLSIAVRLRLISLQVILLIFTLASILLTVMVGHYPDGYAPQGGAVFIFSDQAIAAVVSAFHVITVLMLPFSHRELAA